MTAEPPGAAPPPPGPVGSSGREAATADAARPTTAGPVGSPLATVAPAEPSPSGVVAPAPDDAGAPDGVLPRWVLSGSLTAAVVIAVLFAGAGLLLGRPDLALLALPFVGAATWAWDRRPRRDAAVTIAAEIDARADDAELGYRLTVAAPRGTEAVDLRLASLGDAPQQLVVTPATARRLRGVVPVLHSGPQEVLRAEYRLMAPEASFISLPAGPLSVNRVVPPPHRAIGSLPLPHRLQGLTGNHDSARPGDGGEFRDIHPYQPGDRLRRIDWKATARRGRFAGDLYVRRTAATADATVLVVLDSRDDVGEQVREWSRNSAGEKGLGSLDLAREAAGSLAAGYIRAGDRVGFQDLASQARMIAHGGGSRHLQRLLRAIELTRPYGQPAKRQRPPAVVSGALIFVLSTFLDEEAGRMAALWRGGGHRVIAVDVLPAPRFDRAGREERIAHRIIMMERADRMRILRAQGVEILPWQETPASPREAALRTLARPPRRLP